MNKFIQKTNIKLNKVRRYNKIKLIKSNNFSNSKIIFSKKLIKTDEDNQIGIFGNEVRYFLAIMSSNCKNFNSTLFLKNFRETNFDISNKNNNPNFGGRVGVLENTINFYINNLKNIYHELLHLSTYDLENKRCGFAIFNKCGKGFTESYTQLLTERYFGELPEKAYFSGIKLIKILEKIIGQDKMEKYYFNSSLESLIYDLLQYESKEKISEFISNFDLLIKYDIFSFTNPTENQIKYFEQKITKISDFLLSCIENKVNLILSNKEEVNNFLNELTSDKFTVEISYTNPNTGNKNYIKLFDETKILKLKELIKTLKTKAK